MLSPWAGQLAARVVVVGAGVLFGFLGFLPLVGAPRYESALIAGLILPSAVALAVARRGAERLESPRATLLAGWRLGAATWLAAFLVLVVHAARTGFCDPYRDALFFALGPGFGCLLAGAWGALAGHLSRGIRSLRRRRRLATALGLAAPLGSIGIGLYRFYSSPMVFGYDPFVGYFSGALYETVIEVDGLLSYRAGSVATLIGLGAIATALRSSSHGVRLARVSAPHGLVLAIACATSVLHCAFGSHLDHWHTDTSIRRELAGELRGERCAVFYDRSIAQSDVELFLADCEGHVWAGDAWLGARGAETVTAYLFRTESQKQRLMGAGRVYIAKPWRAEVYLQVSEYPHRSLGHEIMHALAAPFGRGPFHIGADWGGLLPNPGLIEGLAVAGSPKESDLSAAEWSKAMRDLELLPPLEDLFALAFLSQNSSVAYQASGAFVEHVRARHGADVVRAWYGGADLPTLTGASWSEMEQAWHVELDRLTLSDAAIATARARFDRPSIFGRRCPRVVDGCAEEARKRAGRGDEQGAIEQYDRALSLDPHNASLFVERYAVLGRIDAPAATQALEATAQDPARPDHERLEAAEALGDLLATLGEGERARALFEQARASSVNAAVQRRLDVKAQAASDEALRPIAFALLAWRGEQGPSALELTDRLRAETADVGGLGAYLVARQHFYDEKYGLAEARLDEALARGVDLGTVRAEIQRLRILTRCAQGDADGAADALIVYRAEPDASSARIAFLERFVARCRRDPALLGY